MQSSFEVIEGEIGIPLSSLLRSLPVTGLSTRWAVVENRTSRRTTQWGELPLAQWRAPGIPGTMIACVLNCRPPTIDGFSTGVFIRRSNTLSICAIGRAGKTIPLSSAPLRRFSPKWFICHRRLR
jgi:hypothetical protein